jgi:hypothetical protein
MNNIGEFAFVPGRRYNINFGSTDDDTTNKFATRPRPPDIDPVTSNRARLCVVLVIAVMCAGVYFTIVSYVHDPDVSKPSLLLLEIPCGGNSFF